MKGNRSRESSNFDLDEAKQNADLPSMFEALGVDLSGSGDTRKGKCPFHDDGHHSLGLKLQEDGVWTWKCFAGCGKGTVVDFLTMRDQTDVKGAVNQLREGVSSVDVKPVRKRANSQKVITQGHVKILESAQEKLKQLESEPSILKRYGLTLDDAVSLGLGLDKSGDLLFPIYDTQGKLLSIKKRKAKGEPRFMTLTKGAGAHPWLSPNLGEAQGVILVEGELNAMAAFRALKRAEGLNVGLVGMPGAESGLNGAAELLEGKDIYIHADADKAGRKAREEWADRVKEARAAYVAQLPELENMDFADLLKVQGAEMLSLYLEQEVAELEPSLENFENELGIITLNSSVKVPSTSWVVDGFIPKKRVTILGSDGGVGKSTLAAYMSVCIQTGRPFLGLPTLAVDNILIVDYDDGEPTEWLRWLNRCAKTIGSDIDALGVKYIAGHGTEKMFPELSPKLIELYGGTNTLIILDAFESSMGIDSNKTTEVVEAMTNLKRMCTAGFTVLILDHTPKLVKGERFGSRGLSGSGQKKHQSRSAFLLQNMTPEDFPEKHALIGMHCLKLNGRPMPKPVAFERWTSKDDTQAFFELREMPDMGSRGRPSKGSEQTLNEILSVFADKPETTISDFDQIAATYEISRSTLKRLLAQLERQGLIMSEVSYGQPTIYSRRGPK